MFDHRWAGGAAALAIAASLTPAYAQEITASIRGTVTSEGGMPISGATVTVVNTATGAARTITTGAAGAFNFRNLSVTGTYTVTATAPGFDGQRVEGIALSVGQASNLQFSLASGTSDEVFVTATRPAGIDVAAGPAAVFDSRDLQTLPAINRNITDIIRTDPRLFIDESRGGIDPIQCGGKNPRFNSLTLDGVRLNDGFGLNSNGYPTERQPFPFDAIEQVAVELAPFDVEYGGFTACNINAVTKSGTNAFTGSLFFDYTDDGLQGDSLEGQDIVLPEFDEQRYGFQVGGPIIKDKLFFSVAYEKLEGVNTFSRGVEGSGAINEVAISQAEIDEILAISRDVYQYDPGFVPEGFDNEDEKILVKLDWNINENHRAAFTYNWNDGFNTVQSDGDLDEFEFSNHLYERGSELKNYVFSLFSDWTDNFSTELRAGYVDLQNRQDSIGGTDFGEITIETGDVNVYLGGDDSRQSNSLSYEIFQFAAKGYYNSGIHNITFGYEREAFEIFNLFVQHTETEIDFENVELFDATNFLGDANGDGNPDVTEFAPFGEVSAIEAFRLGYADAVFYNNAPSNNPQDAAAEWGYALNTLYAQDEIDLTPSLSVIVGLRYDFWQSDDEPVENADFVADYGFSNSQNLDGLSLLQPRLALNWQAKDNLDIRAGVGRYSGGDPNVWLSNTFSANNVLQFGQRGRSFGLATPDRILINPDTQTVEEALAAAATSLFDTNYSACEDGVPEGPGYCIPTDLFNAVADGVGDNFEINYLDPDFEIPSEWKLNVGATWVPQLPMAGFLGGEYTVTADLLASFSENTAVILRGDLDQVGTTADGRPDFDSPREDSFVLTNSDGEQNRSFTASVSVAKQYDNGVDWSLGYAYNDAQDVQPMTSSVAFSNYNNRAFFDPQELRRSTSDYNISHRFVGTFGWEKEFFGDNATRVNLVGFANSGAPYSFALQNANGFFGFTPFIGDSAGVLLQPGQRNTETAGWWGKIDARFEQEFPGIVDGHKGSAFIIIDNLTNLLNDEWGILEGPDFPPIVNVDEDAFNNGQIVPISGLSRQGDPSRYQIRFGVRYQF
ncbi:MAG: TonB-dependent receptor [Pseudomonadota bacterium]